MNPAPDLNYLILLCLFCWGAWGIADKKALAYGGAKEVMLCLYIFAIMLIPFLLIALNLSQPGWFLSKELVIWAGLASLCYTAALLSYLKAMTQSEASFVLGMTASYPLVLQILATFFLGEKLVVQRMLGGLIVGLGIGLIGGSSNKNEKNASVRPGWMLLFYVTVATLCWGVYGLFDKKALDAGSPLEVFLAQRLWDTAFFVLLVVIFLGQKEKLRFDNARLWLFCGISEVVLAVGGLAYLVALSRASASYVITITGCYPLIMYLLAILFLKEKFNSLRFAGIMMVVAGGITVQLTQGIK